MTTSSSNMITAKHKFKLADFELGRKLGKGKFGRVYCVKHIQSDFICAMKVINKSEILGYHVEKQFIKEIEIQSNVSHINCLAIYGWFDDAENIYLLVEYAAFGELYKILKSQRRLKDDVASLYIYQISLALIHLHDKNIIHRDLKPENVLIHFNNCIKLADFGWSTYKNNVDGKRRNTMCGTLDYLPPEMVEAKNHDNKVDIWAVGVLLYELVVGKPPFEEEQSNLTYRRIVKVDLHIPDFVDKDAAKLIKSLLKYDPNERITLQQVLNHRWILKNKPLWSNLKVGLS
ncbi:aurora kinase [Martiniozyma asiatica (nom. inval.)]|nr:aurora kinase [Martiniozyma asiatica]